jgi:hypothetical protein
MLETRSLVSLILSVYTFFLPLVIFLFLFKVFLKTFIRSF